MNYRLLIANSSTTPTPAATTPPTAKPGLFDLISLRIYEAGLAMHLSWIFLAIVILLILVVPVAMRSIRRRKWSAKKVEIAFPNLFKMEICPDHETARVAYQAWVEIRTRKVGLAFDPRHDVVADVYDSWYQLFQVLRELTKTIDVRHLKDCKETQKLVTVLMRVMNEGLRPHLTEWQAKYRRWWEAALRNPDNENKSPQEIQRQFPHYDEVVHDLQTLNADFVKFAKSLRALADGGEDQ